jgi:hypothetical protein
MEVFHRRKTLPLEITHLPVEGNISMVTILRRTIALVALAVGIGVAAGAAPAAAATTHHASTTHHATVVHSAGAAFAQPNDWWF